MSVFWYGFAAIIAVGSTVKVIISLVEMRRRHRHREAENRYRSAMLAQQRTEMLRQRNYRKTMLALAQTGNGSLEKLALQGAATNQQVEMLVSWFQGGRVELGVDSGGPPLSPPPADGSSSRPPPTAPPQQKGDGRPDPIEELLARGPNLFGLFDKGEAGNLWNFTVLWHSLHGRRSDGKPPAAAELGSSLYVAGPESGAHECDGSSRRPPLAAASRPKRGAEKLRHGEPKKRRPMETELERLCLKYRITARSVYGAADPWPDEWAGRKCHPWTVTLSWRGPQGKSKEPIMITVSFFQGPAHEHPPTAADVLGSLLLDASAEGVGFEDWCTDLGYDSDSTKAARTYRECLLLALKVRAFLGNDQALIDELRAAEH